MCWIEVTQYLEPPGGMQCSIPRVTFGPLKKWNPSGKWHQSEVQERDQAGDADLMSSGGIKTEKVDKVAQRKHIECAEERRARPRTEPQETLTFQGLTWKGSKKKMKEYLQCKRKILINWPWIVHFKLLQWWILCYVNFYLNKTIYLFKRILRRKE